MSFNQFIKLPDEVVKKLSWLGEPFYYIYKDSVGDTLRGALYEINWENMRKAVKRLTGEEGDIISGDKVYMLPNCRIPLFKLKDFLEKTGASLTGEVTEATKIIGHERCFEEVRTQALNSSMLHQIDSPYFESKFKDSYFGDDEDHANAKNEFEKIFLEYIDMLDGQEFKDADTIISHAVWGDSNNFSHGGRETFITPTGAWILYNHILKKIPIINEDAVYMKIGKPSVIDDESYQNIYEMLKSSDVETQRMGAEILANCDHYASLYYIWKLSKKFNWQVNRLSKFKNIRLFLRMSKWDRLNSTNSEEFIKVLHDKGMLTREYFAELITEASKYFIANIPRTEVFSVHITPSEKYKAYGDVQFTINAKPADQDVEIEDEDEETEDYDD